MKKTMIISMIPAAATATAFALLSSCALDPDYREYKAQQKANAVAATTNKTTNPYGVPQTGEDLAAPYTPQPSADGGVPFQPIAGIPESSPAPYTPPISEPIKPNITNGNSYQVIAGDSLWKISRDFGTTVEEIQAANGLTTTTILSGQTLIIPGR